MLTGCLYLRIVIPWRDLFFLEEATINKFQKLIDRPEMNYSASIPPYHCIITTNVCFIKQYFVIQFFYIKYMIKFIYLYKKIIMLFS